MHALEAATQNTPSHKDASIAWLILYQVACFQGGARCLCMNGAGMQRKSQGRIEKFFFSEQKGKMHTTSP